MKQTSRILWRPGRRRSPEQVAEMFEEYHRSGLSLLSFARKHGHCYSTLLRWRARLNRAKSSGAIMLNGATSKRVQKSPAFVPIKIEPECLPSKEDFLLQWSDGRSLRISPHFEQESLRRLLEVLERA